MTRLDDVVNGYDAIDIATDAGLHVECKNVANVLVGGELPTDFVDQIAKHFQDYGNVEYRYVFSKGFGVDEAVITQKIRDAFLAAGLDPDDIYKVQVEFLGLPGTVPF